MRTSAEFEFAASYDTATKFLSVGVPVFLVLVALVTHVAFILLLVLPIMGLSYAYSAQGYRVAGRSIFVRRLAGDVEIPIDNVVDARAGTRDDFRGCIRLWGSGGMFGYYGLFRTSKLGRSTWYVTNRENRVIIVTGKKTVVLSPDQPAEFLAAVRSAAPVFPGGPVREIVPERGDFMPWIVSAVVAIGVLVVALAVSYNPGSPAYTLTPSTLTIHDRFYPVTLQASGVDLGGIRVVDLAQEPEWRIVRRTSGFGSSHYQAGWFRVANGQSVRLYRAGGDRLVLLPPRDHSAPVLYEAKDPDRFVESVRREWSGPL